MSWRLVSRATQSTSRCWRQLPNLRRRLSRVVCTCCVVLTCWHVSIPDSILKATHCSTRYENRLNIELNEDVWVTSPKDISVLQFVCYNLLMAIYKLKRAHLAWHTKLCNDLIRLRFEELPSAPYAFRHQRLKDIYMSLSWCISMTCLFLHTHNRCCLRYFRTLNGLYKLRVSEGVTLFLSVQLY